MNSQEARTRFIRWLSVASPELYTAAAIRANRSNGLGDLAGWVDTLVGAAVAIGGAVLAKKQQSAQLNMQKAQLAADVAAQEAARQDQLRLALIDINTKRAQVGQPPVDLNGAIIPGAQLPALPVSANVTSSLVSANSVTRGMFDDVPLWAWGVGGIVLLFTFSRE